MPGLVGCYVLGEDISGVVDDGEALFLRIGEDDKGKAIAELPCTAEPDLLGGDDNLAGVAVEVTAVAVDVTIDGDAVAGRSAGHPSEFGRDVTFCPSVPHAFAIPVEGMHGDVLRQVLAISVISPAGLFMPDRKDENANCKGGQSDESPALVGTYNLHP